MSAFKQSISNPLSSPSHPPPLASAAYRSSFARDVGRRFIHPALVGAGNNAPQGVKTGSGDKAGDCLVMNSSESELSEFKQQLDERNYRSNIREPLGRGYVRGHQLPTQYNDDNFRFGISTSQSESAKTIIYNPSAQTFIRKEPAAAPLSGDLYAPVFAQQRQQETLITRPLNRDYQWPQDIDPTQHRFGKVKHGEEGRSALQNESGEMKSNGCNAAVIASSIGVERALKHESYNATTIGSIRVVEARANNHDFLGASRPLKGVIAHNEDMVFGRKGSTDEWGAKECIRGAFSVDEQKPEDDLGKSIRRSSRQQLESVPPQHRDRAFGLPSIRVDVTPPTMKSVACAMNYGDESNAKGLLFPCRFANDGVNEEDFLRERSPDYIRTLFKSLNYELPPNFDELCALAKQRYGALSVDSFRSVYNAIRMNVIDARGNRLCNHDDCQSTCSQQGQGAAQPKQQQFSAGVKQPSAANVPRAGFTNNNYPLNRG